MIVDTGGTVSLASPVEMMMGHGMPPIQKFLDRGLRQPERGRRDERAGDMFNQMRSVLGLAAGDRARAGQDTGLDLRGSSPTPRSRARKANGLDGEGRSLTPGKQADVILLRTDRYERDADQRPATAVVAGMGHGNVDTVLIGGR
jgi:cytosine/adenosine deaminase-related metal-dependent hydrolase